MQQEFAQLPLPGPLPGARTRLESRRVADRRIRARLHGGWRYRRQRAALLQMAAGAAETGEMAIYKQGDEILCKLVAWLPRKPRSDKNLTGFLRVRTAHDCLLIAVNDKDETLWRYNGDHLRRWIAEHRGRLQRLSEDHKYENRPVPPFAQRRTDYARKFDNRMKSACHEIAAQLANYAARRRFAGVVYDDTERGFAPQFQYFRLAALIQEKLDAAGIEFTLARAEVQPEARGTLARE